MSEFQNPQNQPGIDKRVMVVFAATMVLLVLAQQFLVKPKQQAIRSNRRRQSAPAPAVSPGSPSLSTVPAAEASTTPVAAVKAESEKTTVVENDLYRITFSNRGGLVKSWILKKYKDEQGQPLELVHSRRRRNMATLFRCGPPTRRCARS